MTCLWPLLQSKLRVLSFHSLPDEIDMKELNERLNERGCLYLPRIDQDRLCVYRTLDPHTDLVQNAWGLWEPCPDVCVKLDPSSIDCILVPGLGFDRDHYRIGYGKGHYDGFLSRHHAPFTIGVGFQEQLCEGILPREEHDLPVEHLILV